VVVTFLALLELIRLKQVRASQPEAFGEIEISKMAQAPPLDSWTEPAPATGPAPAS
jgi:segregation and condensation protein A